jgi:hypothetical protein
MNQHTLLMHITMRYQNLDSPEPARRRGAAGGNSSAET